MVKDKIDKLGIDRLEKEVIKYVSCLSKMETILKRWKKEDIGLKKVFIEESIKNLTKYL